MSAAHHNGEEEDLRRSMALPDGDRSEGRFRDVVHVADVSDLMRRMVTDELLESDCAPRLSERIAHAVSDERSDGKTRLYKDLTDSVLEEFNSA